MSESAATNPILDTLLARLVEETITADELAELGSLLDGSPAVQRRYVHYLDLHAELQQSGTVAKQAVTQTSTLPRSPWRSRPWVGLAAAFVVVAGVLLFGLHRESGIARIVEVGGAVRWTGDGGRVFHDLSVGTQLPGGTVEGLTPDSWFELEFHDGSTVALSGNSMLTFSDHGQKKLHLKEGTVSSTVKPQPAGKPMLIHTRTALLEVLGTQFEVEARLSATMVNVREGTVLVKRLSDGSTVDVPAKHRVIVAADREMLLVPAPGAVRRWTSQLHLGPDGTLGKWSPKTDEEDAKLRAVPFTTHLGKTIYTASFGISRGDKPPVVLQPASRFRVRGHIASTHRGYFGVTVRHPNGEFAGNFQTIRPAVEFQSGRDFEVILHLRDFRLDPSLVGMQNKLPGVPFHLVVESVWCHTLDKQAGLEITKMELISPAEGESD